jgi:hypothetical protein
MDDTSPIDKPIFLIGCGRSGTTTIFRLLAAHQELAYFSNFSARVPRLPQIGLFSRLYPLRLKYSIPPPFSKLIPVPSEAYEIWDHCIPVDNSPNDPPLLEKDICNEHVECLQKTIIGHLRAQGASRFVDKNTRNTRRIAYLNRIFPDARFIHIVRDPRAVVVSFLKVNWWNELQVWCCENSTPAQWVSQGRDPVELAAIIWKEETQCALRAQALLGHRYMRVCYEDFVDDHRKESLRIVEHAGLTWDARFERIVNSYKIVKNTNRKYRNQLSNAQLSLIKDITAPTLQQMGLTYWQ